jgi:mRNA-degrading endonuclease RelE of RelBE toxin-antitoxin system
MTNKRTRQYKKLLAALPKEIQEAATEAYKIFKKDPNSPMFMAKEPKYTRTSNLKPNSIILRLNDNYRIVYAIDGEDRVFYFIGNHSDYNKLVGRT